MLFLKIREIHVRMKKMLYLCQRGLMCEDRLHQLEHDIE